MTDSLALISKIGFDILMDYSRAGDFLEVVSSVYPIML